MSEAQHATASPIATDHRGALIIASYPEGLLLDWAGEEQEAKLAASKAFEVVDTLNKILGSVIGGIVEVEVRGDHGKIVIVVDSPLIRASLERAG